MKSPNSANISMQLGSNQWELPSKSKQDRWGLSLTK